VRGIALSQRLEREVKTMWKIGRVLLTAGLPALLAILIVLWSRRWTGYQQQLDYLSGEE